MKVCLTEFSWRRLVFWSMGGLPQISCLTHNILPCPDRVTGKLWLQEWQFPRMSFAALFLTTAELTVRFIYCPQWWPGGVTFSSCRGACNSLWSPAVTFSGCSERMPLWRYFTSDAKSDFHETQVWSNELFGLLPKTSTERNTCRFSQVHVKPWEA